MGDARAVVGVDELERVVADQLFRRVTGQPPHGRADVADGAARLGDRDDVVHGLGQQPIARLAAAHRRLALALLGDVGQGAHGIPYRAVGSEDRRRPDGDPDV